MEYFGWILTLISIAMLALIYLYSAGWLQRRLKLSRKNRSQRTEPRLEPEPESEAKTQTNAAEPAEDAPSETPASSAPIAAESKVVAIRIVPNPGESFGAENLVLKLRASGFQHGEFDIFHKLDPEGGGRIRYSVASLVEPGSFDLKRLKDSVYPGVTMFLVLPAPEDGLALFDEMMGTARNLMKELEGRLVDEQGTLLSVQRERYMREEVIEFLRQHLHRSERDDMFGPSDR